jgi:hypothetical protein
MPLKSIGSYIISKRIDDDSFSSDLICGIVEWGKNIPPGSKIYYLDKDVESRFFKKNPEIIYDVIYYYKIVLVDEPEEIKEDPKKKRKEVKSSAFDGLNF